MFASGKNVRKLEVEKIAIKRKEPYLNPKEATVEQLINVKWSLFFEYANDNKSKVGRAFSKKPEGPWIIEGEFLKTREDSWNSYHLSVALALRWITSTIKR
jgi:hypothetical protein